MKVFMRFAAVAAIVLSVWNCGGGTQTKVSSQGGLYEIIAVCEQNKWDGALGDTLRSIMNTPVEMINQYEPAFTLLQVQPQAFNTMIGRNRNLLIVKNGSEFEKTAITAQYDVFAAPQIVVYVTGPTISAIIAYLDEHRSELVQVFEIAERDRALTLNRQFNERTLVEMVEKKFGVHIDVPKGFLFRAESDNFIWISHERPQTSQGFFIYSYPYTGKEDFELEHLVARRDEFAARIPGPAEGSYMITYTDDPDPGLYPRVGYMSIAGRHWAKLNGLWDVHGDYMGGPFFSYSTLTPDKTRVVAIDCYLFSPKHPKRNFLRQLEHLIYSVSFTEEGAAQ